jgi:hypothetical protein
MAARRAARRLPTPFAKKLISFCTVIREVKEQFWSHLLMLDIITAVNRLAR